MVLKIFMNPNKYIKTEKILGWNKKKKKKKKKKKPIIGQSLRWG